MALISRNPATGEELARFEEMSPDQVEGALRTAHEEFLRWRRRPVAERVALVAKLAEVLRKNQPELAELATLEMGKIIGEATGEVEKSAWFCDYYAENAERLLAPRRISGAQSENWIQLAPVGPILAVMPWNFPYVQVFRFAPAVLAAGNVVLLKHASNVPRCAKRIEEMFTEAGFPRGCFQTLLVEPPAVEGILSDDRVQGVTLTGSERAGSTVAAIAGRELKRSVMELGGSDPFIVLDDADVPEAARVGCLSRFTNAGQACINAKRFIVVDSVADEFEEALATAVRKLKVGDPLDPETQIGPLADRRFVTTLRGQVESSIEAGATLRAGGFVDDEPGTFVNPILLTGVTRRMRVFREEVFGPVASVIRVPDEQTAVSVANDSPYGLGASVWTKDTERGHRVAEQIDAGMVFVNAQTVSDGRLPFGGVKRSGYGRELGEWGIREFTEVKSIAVVTPQTA